MSTRATVNGIESAIRAIGKSRREIGETIAAGLLKAGNIIKKKADYYCPVETGALIATGEVVVSGVGFGASVAVSYGGKEAPYALWVHQIDATHASPTCYKWLERATKESKGTITAMLGREIKEI